MAANGAPQPLPVDALRWRCDPATFPADGTAALPSLGDTMGQERALAALTMGLELYAPGYNIFVSGLTGTGRTSTVKRILEGIQPHCALAPDRAYVHHFAEPDQPKLLTLPRGTARSFAHEMEEFVAYLKKTLPAVFDDDTFKQRRDALVEKYAEAERGRLEELRTAAKAEGLALVQIEMGPVVQPEVLPVLDGEPVDFEELRKREAAGTLSAADLARLTERQRAHRQQLEKHLTWARQWARAMGQELDELARQMATGAVAGPLADVKARFPHEGVAPWLKQVEQHVLDHLERFLARDAGAKQARRKVDQFVEYQVNVIQDQSGREGCPTIVETQPSYSNLFGTIEREVGPGNVVTADHTKIRGGALLRADGGYLVANAIDVFTEPGVWTALKRTLKSGLLSMRPPDAYFFPYGPGGLKPEPIPVNVKVILIGDGGLYHMAAEVEPEFRKIFKVLAEFETDVPRTDENLQRFAQVAATVARGENLAQLSPDGVAALIEFAVRRAGRQNRLSVRFSETADLLREADYWRRRETLADRIGAAEVRRAIEAHRHRHSRIEERLREYIHEGVIHVATQGAVVGQVNGLAVLDFGVYAFGKPARISATTAPGRAGVINIERRAQLSGSSHDKGVLILSGFLRSRFARRAPLALTASVAFEQSYSGVDGDSASSTEAYALLSSLAGTPIRQSLAVTGSVDQAGRVQAIGGVNEKIEGFFDVCRERGLTGEQGVLIPKSNVRDLMLRADVIEAVRDGRFRVYPVATVDEGIALLTGVPAGVPGPDGTFPSDSVNGRAQARLDEYARTVRALEVERGEDE